MSVKDRDFAQFSYADQKGETHFKTGLCGYRQGDWCAIAYSVPPEDPDDGGGSYWSVTHEPSGMRGGPLHEDLWHAKLWVEELDSVFEGADPRELSAEINRERYAIATARVQHRIERAHKKLDPEDEEPPLYQGNDEED